MPSRAQRERMARLLAAESDAELEPELADAADARPAVEWSTPRARARRAKLEALVADEGATDHERAAARAALDRMR